MDEYIVIKDLFRTFNHQSKPITVLKNINLTIQKGEMVAIVGASGSGKSTLMNILGCLDKPDQGFYFLSGENVSNHSSDQLSEIRREKIGFIFQKYHLLNDLTAIGNIEIPAIYANKDKKYRSNVAISLLNQLGLKGREHHKPNQLSGGQQQRVSIARALVNGGEIILADEPTGALDTQSGQEVLSILKSLHKQGYTLVIVTHDHNVAHSAGRIIELKNGEILSDTGASEIYSRQQAPLQFKHKYTLAGKLGRIKEAGKMAFKAMNAHRLRTFLTMAGIIFGIASVVTVEALGTGAKIKTIENIRELGTNTISIFPGNSFFDESASNVKTLTTDDSDLLAKQIFIESASPEISMTNNVRIGSGTASASIKGVSSDFFHVQGMPFIKGGNFTNDRDAAQEAIIDFNTANALAAKSENNILGETILVGAVPLKIVGIVKIQSEQEQNKINIWVPYTTMMYRIQGQQHLSSIVVRVKDGFSNTVAEEIIIDMLMLRHKIKDFMLFNRDQYRKTIEQTASTLNTLIMSVASIALTIGCFGVMNIMLVSVSERTHEIGIRVAVGARRRDIMQQFLIEAVVVCLVGGVLGIIFSFLIGVLIPIITSNKILLVYSWRIAFGAFIFSSLIGVIFGYLPAKKAAAMNPVASLASE